MTPPPPPPSPPTPSRPHSQVPSSTSDRPQGPARDGVNPHRLGGFTKAELVELIVLDVDGVLTDGSVYLDDGGREFKRFNIRDGLGLRAWQRAGFGVGVITGRSGGAVQHRCAELGIGDVVLGSGDKVSALRALCERRGVDMGRVAYMGDDWPDLGVMRRAGFPASPADAAGEVLEASCWVSTRAGGRGAVRELCEHLLEARGLMPYAVGHYDR